ncbi:MAG: hypothetical protein HOP23_17535 [Methylococcaceae bacterium]|nr:hypothetical protein [Methylococcaceae bacterium]
MKQYFLLISLLLSGCATQKLSVDDRQKLALVRINPIARISSQLYYYGPEQAFSSLGHAIGGAIGSGIASEAFDSSTNNSKYPVYNYAPTEDFQLNRKSIQLYAEKKKIFIDKIVLEELKKALENSGKVHLTESPKQSLVTFNTNIIQYGFSVPNGLSSKLVPMLNILFTLVDVDGKIIWKANDYTLPLGNPVEAIPADEIKTNPKLIENAWRDAARSIITNIINDL